MLQRKVDHENRDVESNVPEYLGMFSVNSRKSHDRYCHVISFAISVLDRSGRRNLRNLGFGGRVG